MDLVLNFLLLPDKCKCYTIPYYSDDKQMERL